MGCHPFVQDSIEGQEKQPQLAREGKRRETKRSQESVRPEPPWTSSELVAADQRDALRFPALQPFSLASTLAQSMRMLDSLATFVHLVISARRKPTNSSGELMTYSLPLRANFSLTSGLPSARAASA